MVRNYVKKSSYRKWTTEDMTKAIIDTLEGRISKHKASKVYNIPRNTLWNRIKQIKSGCITVEQSFYKTPGSSTVLTGRQERILVEHILLLDSRLFNVKCKDIRRLAYELAEFGNRNRFSKTEKMAGQQWLTDFFIRHPALPVHQFKTVYNDSSSVDRKLFDKFFDITELLVQKYNILPDSVYSLDEFGITALPNMASEVITKSTKIEVLSELDKPGALISSICCASAVGTFMPPSLVFPLETEDISLLKDVPENALIDFHVSGRIQPETFSKWMEKFVEFSKPTRNKPVLLILDGNSRHAKSFAFVNIARQNNVHLLSFPLNSVDCMSPLGGFLDVLSLCYKDEVALWTENHLEESITLKETTELFIAAFSKAAVAKVAVEGFKETGLVPINRSMLPQNIFESSPSTEKMPSVKDQLTVLDQSNILPEISWFSETLIVMCEDPLPIRPTWPLRKPPKTFHLSKWRNRMKQGLKEVVPATDGHNSFYNVTNSNFNSLVTLEDESSSSTSGPIENKDNKFSCLNPEDILINDIKIKEEQVDNEYADNSQEIALEADADKLSFENTTEAAQMRNPHSDLESNLTDDQPFSEMSLFEMVKVEIEEQEQSFEETMEGIDSGFNKNYEMSPNKMEQDNEESSNGNLANMSNTMEVTNDAFYKGHERVSTVQRRRMFKCSKCGQEFQWRRGLILHQMTMHKETRKKRSKVTKTRNSKASVVEGLNGKSIAVTPVSSSKLPVVLAVRPSEASQNTSDDKDVFFKILREILRTIPEVHRQATKQKIMQLVYNVAARNMDPSTVTFVT